LFTSSPAPKATVPYPSPAGCFADQLPMPLRHFKPNPGKIKRGARFPWPIAEWPRPLPFGTFTNKNNGRSITVRINDRGRSLSAG
jgi:hypothetical protein